MSLTDLLGMGLAAIAVATCFHAVRRQSTESHRRGVVVRAARSPRAPRLRPARRRFARAAAAPAAVRLAGRRVAYLDETKHFKMIGTTGTGKSTAIAELLGSALDRGDRAIFADPDGGYRERFFRRYRGDIVLNPFERDSVRWDPFLELGNAYDVDQMAAGLVPATDDGAANEWRGYARTFLVAVLRHCRASPRPDARELWRVLSAASNDELRAVVAGTPAQPFLDPDNARMFGSIRAVAVSALAALEYVQRQRAAPFSLREWVGKRHLPGAVFITYRANQIAALRSIISNWLRLAIFETMDAGEAVDQRLWFVVDELDALGPIAGLKDALARLRKFGGRCVLGFQSIAQVSGAYGAAEAQTLVENCGTTLILRCAGSESGGTSQFASRLIGEREIVRRQTAHGSDRDSPFSGRGARRSRNVSTQHVTELAVLASQIEQLPDLCGYLKHPSSPEWRLVHLRPQPHPEARHAAR